MGRPCSGWAGLRAADAGMMSASDDVGQRWHACMLSAASCAASTSAATPAPDPHSLPAPLSLQPLLPCRKWALIFVAIAIGSVIINTLQGWCFGVMGCRLARRVRVMFLGAVLRQEQGWFDSPENNSGEIMSRLSTDVSALRGGRRGGGAALQRQWAPCPRAACALALSQQRPRQLAHASCLKPSRNACPGCAAGAVGDAVGAAAQNIAMVVIGLTIAFTARCGRVCC